AANSIIFGKRLERRLVERRIRRVEGEMVSLRSLQALDQARGQQALSASVQQAVDGLELLGGAIAGREDESAAPAEVVLQPVDVAGGQAANVAQTDAVVFQHVGFVDLAELLRGHLAGTKGRPPGNRLRRKWIERKPQELCPTVERLGRWLAVDQQN